MKYKINEILSDGYVMGEALKLIKENNESIFLFLNNLLNQDSYASYQ